MLPADPSLSVAERVDAACDRFEAEWKAGRRPRIDDFLAAAQESDRAELRPALVALELELRGRPEAAAPVRPRGGRPARQPTAAATVDHVPQGEPSAGTIGRFEIRGVLGSGAFGKVYRAFDPQLGREVAVKVPLASTVRSEREREQFLKEARSAANVNHPNVCQVHEVGEVDGQPYIVMALVRGSSLADLLKARKGPLPEKQAALVVRKIALALAAAHDGGIVHRDLKPANVMFDRERKDIIVMDFGLARGPKFGDARGTQSGVIMGTPAYMSPEQARGDSKGVGPAGDIFSLGIILYELLAGVRPFTGTATEVIGQILHVEPERPSAVRPGIDPRLEAVCLKALAKDPAARFATMQEFAAAIDAVLRKPAPAGPAAETANAAATRHDGDAESAGTSQNLVEVFAALSADREQARADTAAAVEAAIAKHRTPRWVLPLVGLLFVGGMATLAGIIFFTRSDKVKVDLAVIINDVDLKDKTLSFFLDDEPIAADALANPVELKPGDHVFTVKRGKDIVKRVLISVADGKTPGIEIKVITPPPATEPPPPAKPEWTPLIRSADELVEGETTSQKAEGRTVKYEGGNLILQGAGATYRPKFAGKNYVLRAKVLSITESVFFTVRRNPGTFVGYQAFFSNKDRGWDWPTCGIGKQHVGQQWEGLRSTLQRVEEAFPAELAFSAFGDQLAIYVNGERVVQATDRDADEGGIAIGCYKDFRAVMRDVAVCVLDGTKFTPDDVYPQKRDPEVERILSPDFLTADLKKKNLLKNGDFEDGDSGWQFKSWRNNRNLARVVESPSRAGKHALEIDNRDNDSVEFAQKVEVRPHRRYLFSGWIKTRNIKYEERNQDGADLYAYGWHRYRSQRASATSDWHYDAVIFDSGDRTSVDVAVKLGHFAGTVRGTAWYDDLCLVEIPPRPQVNSTDLDRWQGKWRCVGEKSRGHEWTAEELKAGGKVMVIEGNRYRVERTINGSFGTYLGDFRLDPSRNPKQFDFEGTGPAGARIRLRGVYEFVGTRLRFIYRTELAEKEIRRAGWADALSPSVVQVEFEPAAEADGFTSLLNGKDLTGWKPIGEPKWSWADGRLLGSPAPNKAQQGFLVTEAEYQDVELELEYKLAAGAGSGLFLRADATGTGTGKGQLEVQIVDDEAFPQLIAINKTGAIYNIFPRKADPPIKRNDWNAVRVRLVKRHLEVWINGTQTIDANLDDAADKFTAVPGLTRAKGGIGLQLNQQADVEFRNVRIRPLSN